MGAHRYAMLAGYNRWANARLYAAAARLTDEQYRADRGAFFRSVHGTLNHVLVADRVWINRFLGRPNPPTRLDEILYDDLAALHAARVDEDDRIVAFAQALTDQQVDQPIRFRTVTGNVLYEQELSGALDHFFNHQTHHRGQVHALLTGLVGEAPELDLVYFQRESGTGARRLSEDKS
jgi:uncharacterized damage-inducible protein DinB